MHSFCRMTATVALLASLAGCVAATTQPADLAADQPTVSETTAGATTSTLPARLKAGASWLWACVVKFRTQGVPDAALDELRASILDLSRLTSSGAYAAALDLWHQARKLVTSLAGGAA